MKTIISPRLAQRAIDLSPLGINSQGWYLKDIEAVIHELSKHEHILILGGDLYLVNNYKIKFTYDTWTFEPKGMLHDHENSSLKAREYIKLFRNHPNADKLVVDLVVGDRNNLPSLEDFLDYK